MDNKDWKGNCNSVWKTPGASNHRPEKREQNDYYATSPKAAELFEKYPPKTVWVSSGRLACAKNGEFGGYSASAVAYAWFVWEKGYSGETKLKWFN